MLAGSVTQLFRSRRGNAMRRGEEEVNCQQTGATIMLKKFISIAVCVTIGLATLGATRAGEPSLKDQILAIDKELSVLRKTTLSDPAVQAAEAELRVALAKLKAAEDDVLVRTHPKGKELVGKYRKLLAQYKAQQPVKRANKKPKP
jgi:hypothetical protein